MKRITKAATGSPTTQIKNIGAPIAREVRRCSLVQHSTPVSIVSLYIPSSKVVQRNKSNVFPVKVG